MVLIRGPFKCNRLYIVCLTLLFLVFLIYYGENRDRIHLKKITSIDDAKDEVPNVINEVNSLDKPSVLTKEEVASGKLRLAQDDELLLDFIRLHHLKPPGKGKVELTENIGGMIRGHEQQEVFRFIINTLKNQVGGFFIECGASDGEFYSNTIELELKFNWTGLLIEADPRPLKSLLRRNRHAWVASACLSTKPYPIKIEMLRNDKAEGLSFIPGYRELIGKEKDYYQFEAQCFSVYSLLKAINVTTIDYFSLDIEGAELDVLKTIPWESVFIKMLSVEVHPQYVEPVKKYMTSVGYKYLKFIQNGYSHDQIYIHKSLQNNDTI